MEGITASEIAGLSVGALLFCATVAAPKVDAFISSSQRSLLGMCKKCGDLKWIACSKCKGVGFIKERGALSFIFADEPDQLSNAPRKAKSCPKCQAKGRFPCPNCSQNSSRLDILL